MTMREELIESFRVFDTEKTGAIPLAELRYFLRSYGVAMSE
jgi:Ca2+-binding EF-hand superfamily protein